MSCISGGPSVTNCLFFENAANGAGGGMNNSQNSAFVLNCVFIGNMAQFGAGMRNSGGSPTIIDCTFIQNSASSNGGGISNVSDANATLIDCAFNGNRAGPTSSGAGGALYVGSGHVNLERGSFHENEAMQGGGVYLSPSSGVGTHLAYCSFTGNTANQGAGLYLSSAFVAPTIVNCVFNGNSADDSGGGIYSIGSSLANVTNCTFSGNAAWSSRGGAIRGIGNGPELTNCVLWGNNDIGGFGESAQIFVESPSVDYSCVQGWTGLLGGVGNFGADPLFVGPPLLPGMVAGDLRLSTGSPCIDAADNGAVPPEVTTDLDGNPRFVDDPLTVDTGVGTPPIVDMGAYEYQGFEDCNDNGAPDDQDIAAGTSQDCNTNGVPDECDIVAGSSDDLNGNGVPDECEECVGSPDCSDGLFCNGDELCVDGNCLAGVEPCPGQMCDEGSDACVDCLDDVDCDDGQFCTGTESCVGGVCDSAGDDPCGAGEICAEAEDQCLSDCNSNGVSDRDEILAGTSPDCNENGVPDECELAPEFRVLSADFETGLPDGWTASGLWHATAQCPMEDACDTPPWAYFGLDGACDFDTDAPVQGHLETTAFVIPPNAVAAALTYCSIYEGDRGFASIPFGYDLAWVAIDGELVDDVGPTPALGVWETREVDLSAYIGQSVTATWEFNSVDAVSNETLGWQVDAIDVIVVTNNDCNANGVPDDCEDCNSNSFADECDVAAGTSADCNSNGIPDECDVAAADCNTNSVPDDCDPDFDSDGAPDDCDADVDGDGVPNEDDVCAFTPTGTAVNPHGGPLGDVDDDCLVTLDDYFFFEICLWLSGPGGDPVFQECTDVFDFDGDGDVDLADFARLQRLFQG